jgi:hypothetical protein
MNKCTCGRPADTKPTLLARMFDRERAAVQMAAANASKCRGCYEISRYTSMMVVRKVDQVIPEEGRTQ